MHEVAGWNIYFVCVKEFIFYLSEVKKKVLKYRYLLKTMYKVISFKLVVFSIMWKYEYLHEHLTNCRFTFKHYLLSVKIALTSTITFL